MPAKTSILTPRRKAPTRSRHQDQKLLLALGAVCAVLAGWLALAGGAPATTAAGQAVAGTVQTSAPAVPGSSVPRASIRPSVPPRPIAHTRSSR